MNKLHPSRIFSPSVNYHKQMLDRLAIWFGSSFWVPPRSVSAVPVWLLALGTQPTMGTAATKHNGGFNWVNFLVNAGGIDAAISFARIFIHWCHVFFFLDLDQRHSSRMWTAQDASMRKDYNILRLLPNLGTTKMSGSGCTSTEERSLQRWHLLGHLHRHHRHCNKYD